MATVHREYIIPLPITPDQYKIAQLYTVAKVSLQESTGDTSIQIDKNEDKNDEKYGKCRYTEKIFYLNSKVPGVIRAIVPSKALILEEKAFNSFPICHTFYKNRYFGIDEFFSSVISNHKIKNSFSEYELPSNYPKNLKNSGRENIYEKIFVKNEDFEKSKFIMMDICENIQNKKFNPNNMEVNGINLKPKWFEETDKQHMVCQKFVTVKLNKFLLSGFVNLIADHVDKLFLSAHQQMICTYDEWKDLTLEDIRNLEKEAKENLNAKKGTEI